MLVAFRLIVSALSPFGYGCELLGHVGGGGCLLCTFGAFSFSLVDEPSDSSSLSARCLTQFCCEIVAPFALVPAVTLYTLDPSVVVMT